MEPRPRRRDADRGAAPRHRRRRPSSTAFADIGTLEPGKLADLVILDADPTQDIRNTDHIDRVMLNGRLYDAATLNEIVTGNRRRQPYFWEDGQGDRRRAAKPWRARSD